MFLTLEIDPLRLRRFLSYFVLSRIFRQKLIQAIIGSDINYSVQSYPLLSWIWLSKKDCKIILWK